VILVQGLHVSYGDFEAVRGIDLEVSRGEVFAFLGPNGARKTTTVELLEGYLKRSAGEVAVLGVDSKDGYYFLGGLPRTLPNAHGCTQGQRLTRRLGRVRPRDSWLAAQRSISGRSQSFTRPGPKSNTGFGMSGYRR